jgi:hypothetical protein
VIGILAALVVAAAPSSRVFIAGGAKTRAEAQKLERALKLPKALKLAAGFPKLVESKSIEGLNPGFFIVVLGSCGDGSAAETSHSNGLAALIQRSLKGAYAKPVPSQPMSCPLWLEASEVEPSLLASLTRTPDDRAVLLSAAKALHGNGEVLGASILLRRAVALGAQDEETLTLLKTVEFVLEDAPFRLPP